MSYYVYETTKECELKKAELGWSLFRNAAVMVGNTYELEDSADGKTLIAISNTGEKVVIKGIVDRSVAVNSPVNMPFIREVNGKMVAPAMLVVYTDAKGTQYAFVKSTDTLWEI